MLITPTVTLTPTDTPMVDTATITPTAMPASADITYLASTTKHPDLACKWMGVGGTVMDVNNKPLQFQTIQLGGTLNGNAVTGQVLSGNNPAYGTSGFEIKLADSAADSTQTLWVQLFDNNGKALTDKIYFDTYNDCQKNLVNDCLYVNALALANKKMRPGGRIFLFQSMQGYHTATFQSAYFGIFPCTTSSKRLRRELVTGPSVPLPTGRWSTRVTTVIWAAVPVMKNSSQM